MQISPDRSARHSTWLSIFFFLWEHIWYDTLERCINNVTSRYRDSLSDIFVDTVLHQWAMENVKSNFYQRNKTIVGANGAMQKNRSHPEHVTWLRSRPKHQRLNLQQKHLKQSSRFERHSVFFTLSVCHDMTGCGDSDKSFAKLLHTDRQTERKAGWHAGSLPGPFNGRLKLECIYLLYY